MRIFIFLSMMVLLSSSKCNPQHVKSMEEAIVEYKASTRGFYFACTIHDQKLITITERGGKETETPLTKVEVQNLATAFEEINLEQLENLEAPSEKRKYDGAPHATLRISKDGKLFQTNSFDHGNPPKEIKKFIDLMLKYSKK